MKKQTSLTNQQYQILDDAYRLYNVKLFANQLPDCMIVLHRKGKRNLGYFHPERFVNREVLEAAKKAKKKNSVKPDTDELSLNPDSFIGRSDTAILSTLLHEMVHVWQFHLGQKYSRNGYHNKEWGNKMKEVGLYPSNTGDEGGKETGQQMTHYIIRKGKFETLTIAFLKNRSIKLSSFPISKEASSQNKNKVKFSCPSCSINAWGKPDLNIHCGDCDERMDEV